MCLMVKMEDTKKTTHLSAISNRAIPLCGMVMFWWEFHSWEPRQRSLYWIGNATFAYFPECLQRSQEELGEGWGQVNSDSQEIMPHYWIQNILLVCRNARTLLSVPSVSLAWSLWRHNGMSVFTPSTSFFHLLFFLAWGVPGLPSFSLPRTPDVATLKQTEPSYLIDKNPTW